jgi:hypothetical protein
VSGSGVEVSTECRARAQNLRGNAVLRGCGATHSPLSQWMRTEGRQQKRTPAWWTLDRAHAPCLVRRRRPQLARSTGLPSRFTAAVPRALRLAVRPGRVTLTAHAIKNVIFLVEFSVHTALPKVRTTVLTRSVLPGRRSQKCIEVKTTLHASPSRLTTQYGPSKRTREAESSLTLINPPSRAGKGRCHSSHGGTFPLTECLVNKT